MKLLLPALFAVAASWPVENAFASPDAASEVQTVFVPEGATKTPPSASKKTASKIALLRQFEGVREELIAWGDRLAFVAADVQSGYELWVSDGTLAGTKLVKDIYLGDGGDHIGRLFAAGEKLFFRADDGTERFGREVWTSDGSPSGTAMLTDLTPGSGSTPSVHFGMAGSTVLIGSWGNVWTSNGTAEGTVKILEIGPGDSSHIRWMRSLGAGVCFINTYELWCSDGTRVGTRRVRKFHDDIESVGRAGQKIFVGLDELWVSDGTEAGTRQVVDLIPGPKGSEPTRFWTVGNTLYFVASNGVAGRELWRTEGTQETTSLVADLTPGFKDTDFVAFGSGPTGSLVVVTKGERRFEFWRASSAHEGLQKLFFLPTAGFFDAEPTSLVTVANELFFILKGGLWSWKEGAAEPEEVAKGIPLDNGGMVQIDSLVAVGKKLFVAGGLREAALGVLVVE